MQIEVEIATDNGRNRSSFGVSSAARAAKSDALVDVVGHESSARKRDNVAIINSGSIISLHESIGAIEGSDFVTMLHGGHLSLGE